MGHERNPQVLSYGDLAARVSASYSEKPALQFADDIRLMLDKRDDELLVIVPGTTDLAGWLDDFSAWPSLFPELGFYHFGFGHDGIQLYDLLYAHLPITGMVTYVGHSLGGALAQVLAIMHGRGTLCPFRLVTFGCPRGAAIWNLQAKSYLKSAKDLKRFNRVGDPVPSLPEMPSYKHIIPATSIGKPLLSGGAFTNHNIDLYAADLKAVGL